MKAIILSAGQGRRLLPLTAEAPKCLLPVRGQRSILHVQLDALAACGVESATVMVGFGAELVERALAEEIRPELPVTTRYNPFYSTSDNLITCWLAQAEMQDDFMLLNGDTLFEPGVADAVLSGANGPATIAVSHKPLYDDDDMKVVLGPDRCLRAIGKKLDAADPDGEAIGMSVFRGTGAQAFQSALEAAVRRPESLRSWYTSVLHDLASRLAIRTVSLDGLWWAEIDDQADLESARAGLRACGVGAGPGSIAPLTTTAR
jgi:choline kinase